MSDGGKMNEHPSDDLAAFSLGALEPAEEAELREHLEQCERCRSEVLWLQPAVDILPSSVEQLQPPRRLRRELMKTVRADAREQRGSWWSRRPGLITIRARPALAVGAMALLGAGIGGYVVNGANPAAQRVITEVRADPIDIAPSSAAAVLEHSESGAKLVVERLPELDENSVYQLWFRNGDDYAPASTFTLDEENHAVADVGRIPDGTDEVAVTKEPAGGSDQPRGAVLLAAPIT
ncbi:MAG: anti-sigma factor domain-containing protein [Solirubrobacterales bacterium]